jgi:hypothetical protein
MTRISSDLLSHTLNIVQLARETALAQGEKSRAGQLSSVADNLRTVVQNQAAPKKVEQTASTAAPRPAAAAPVSGVLAQNDFKTLLAAAQKTSTQQPGTPTAKDISTRHQVVQAMSAAQMNEVEIARQLGITREEVGMIISISQSKLSAKED